MLQLGAGLGAGQHAAPVALPPVAGLHNHHEVHIAVDLAVVVGSALRRCSAGGAVAAVGLSAALVVSRRTAAGFEAVVTGAVAVAVGLSGEAVAWLRLCRTPRIVRRRRQRHCPMDVSALRATVVAAAVAVAAVTISTASRSTRVSHFHPEVVGSCCKLSLQSFHQHGHELQRERAAPSTFVSLAPYAAAPQSYEPTTSDLYTLLPLRPTHYLLCCCFPNLSLQPQANQFERNYDARRLCNWEVRRLHMHADGLTRSTHAC